MSKKSPDFKLKTTIFPDNQPDLKIKVDKTQAVGGGYCYRFIVDSRVQPLYDYLSDLSGNDRLFRTQIINHDPEEEFHQIFSQIDDIYTRYRKIRNGEESEEESSEFLLEIDRIGKRLYDTLFPNELKELYWSYIHGNDDFKTIQIISDEYWIPWELVKPYDGWRQDIEFLCDRFILTRWPCTKFSNSDPSYLLIDLDRLKIIANENIEQAIQEKREIQFLLNGRVEDITPTFKAVQELFRNDNFSFLHFACHGKYNRKDPDKSLLYLSKKQRISPLDITGKFDPEKPFIFLNACETGEVSDYIGTIGWVKKFIKEANAIGFIGSSWKINSESACLFATTFYHNLLNKKTVGESAKEARQAIKRVGDPSWLSYTIYAHPFARIM